MSTDLDLVLAFEAAPESQRLSAATRLTRQRLVMRFSAFLGEDKALCAATTADVKSWLESRKLSTRTRWEYVNGLHHFYVWVVSEDLAPADPTVPLLFKRDRVDEGDLYELLRGFRIAEERRGLAPSTIVRRRDQLRLLHAFMEPRSMLDATADDIERWIDTRKGIDSRKVSARTRYHMVSNTHAFFSWALREGLVEADPTVNIMRPKLPYSVPRPISDDDLSEALRQAPPNIRAWLALRRLPRVPVQGDRRPTA